jgi:uncharacterized membrane protein
MRALGRAVGLFLVFGVAGYAIWGYAFMPVGSLVHPAMKPGFVPQAAGIYVHVFASVLALALGPFQFSSRLRAKRPALHRWTGRLYLGVGVLVGGLAALYLAPFAFGGPVARLGFGTLAAAWLYTGARAYFSIRGGAVADHRRWMARNYALTLAAVTLRLYIPLSVVAGIEFSAAYAVIAWLCWVPNLAVAEWRSRSPGREVAPA